MIPEKFRKNISAESFSLSFLPFILFNTVISMLISLKLLKYGDQFHDIFSIFSTLIPFISHYFLMNFLLGCLVYIPSLFLHRKLSFVIKIAGFSLFHAFVLMDVRIYTIFRFHINSLVLNIISTEGADDSVILGSGTVLTLILQVLFIVVIEVFFLAYVSKSHMTMTSNKKTRLGKAMTIAFISLLVLIVVDKGLYAYGDLFNKVTITRNAKLLPLYQPLTIKRFAADVLNIQVNRETDIKISSDRSILNYPKRDLSCEPSHNKRLNILMIVVDGLRFDMLTEETMPNTWEFSKKSIVYENHYSGGNGTRFGIFSLLYGIQGTYWHNFLAQRQSPVLVDTLIDHGYDFRILSSTRLTFPEFRKTAFLKIPDTITDTFNIGDASARDRIITDELIDFMSQRDNAKPFFAFVFYDAPHQPYLYPDNFEKFKPVSNKEINYFKDIGRERIHLLRNRYKNAVFFDDSLIGDILTSLKALDRLDDTLVIITGDHGEEFYENGYFGHTSAFNDYQLKTVFIMHVPNNGNLIVTRLTSHHDVVPTILQSLGCTSPDEDYSQGISLLHEGHHTYITASKWDKSAIIDDDHVIAFSTELYNLGNLEIRSKSDYSEVEDSRALIKKKKGLLIDVSRKMSEFYK